MYDVGGPVGQRPYDGYARRIPRLVKAHMGSARSAWGDYGLLEYLPRCDQLQCRPLPVGVGLRDDDVSYVRRSKVVQRLGGWLEYEQCR